MSWNFNNHPTKADKEVSALKEVVDEISETMANEINDLKALLSERDLEIQEHLETIKQLKTNL